MKSRSITLCHLYPNMMNLYGDRGNVLTLEQRCRWHGLEPQVASVDLGEKVDFTAFDIICIGGGQDREQKLICHDFEQVKGKSLHEAVEDDVVLVAVCGGYQLMGQYYTTGDGAQLPGLSIFDVWTQAGSTRMIGNVVIETELVGQLRTLVGFENHSGHTFLGPRATPLGYVRKGYGNNGADRTEGVVYKNSIGTYLHGSMLPKNPSFADWLISRALERRYGEVELRRLDNDIEERAHDAVLKRFG
ncbi:MAG TPA: hypothetical protein V6D03_08820 [Candidatus Caenarcaniphilales bacterium]